MPNAPQEESVCFMQANNNGQSFRRRIWREIEPIVNHAVAVLLLEISLLLLGLVTLALEHIFPKQEFYFSIIEKVDIWLALALLCLFGLYTLIIVSIRLFRAVRREAHTEISSSTEGSVHD